MKKYDPEKIARELCEKLPLQPSLPGMEEEAKETSYSIIYKALREFDFGEESREDVYDQGYDAGYEAADDNSPDCDFCEAKRDGHEQGYEEGYEKGHEEGFEEGKEAWKKIPEEQKRMFNFNGTPNFAVKCCETGRIDCSKEN